MNRFTLFAGVLAVQSIFSALTCFAQAQAGGSFGDVPQTHWAYDAVQSMTQKGIFSGYASDGTYSGRRALTRYEAATAFLRLEDQILSDLKATNHACSGKLELDDSDAQVPSDLKPAADGKAHWGAAAAEKLARQGVVVGYRDQDGSIYFGGRRALTRYEFAAMLYRFQTTMYRACGILGFPPSAAKRIKDRTGCDGKDRLQIFHDVPNSHWIGSMVDVIAEQGMVIGFEDGKFRGAEVVTRYGAAVTLQRLLQQFERDIAALGPAPQSLDAARSKDQ